MVRVMVRPFLVVAGQVNDPLAKLQPVTLGRYAPGFEMLASSDAVLPTVPSMPAITSTSSATPSAATAEISSVTKVSSAVLVSAALLLQAAASTTSPAAISRM